MEKYTAIKDRANRYKEILKQVINFREIWESEKSDFLLTTLQEIIDATQLEATIKQEQNIEGLAVVSVRLGIHPSGLAQPLESDEKKIFLKDFGSLVYSQLFNGKLQVWMSYPFIEGLLEPKPPKLVEIITPLELNEGIVLNHFDSFLKNLIEWEDFDDDAPNHAPIGFGLMSKTESKEVKK